MLLYLGSRLGYEVKRISMLLFKNISINVLLLLTFECHNDVRFNTVAENIS